LAERIGALESSIASSSKSVVATVVPSKGGSKVKPTVHPCQYCPKGHYWPTEQCWKNPACPTPAEKRIKRKDRKKTVASITDIAPSEK